MSISLAVMIFQPHTQKKPVKQKQSTDTIFDHLWLLQETITDPYDERPHKPTTAAFIRNFTPGGTGRLRVVHRRRRQLLPRRGLHRASRGLQGTGKCQDLFTLNEYLSRNVRWHYILLHSKFWSVCWAKWAHHPFRPINDQKLRVSLYSNTK